MLQAVPMAASNVMRFRTPMVSSAERPDWRRIALATNHVNAAAHSVPCSRGAGPLQTHGLTIEPLAGGVSRCGGWWSMTTGTIPADSW